MKITDIKVHLLERKLSSSMQISRGGFNKRLHTIVEVHTDEGVTGLGEGVGNASYVYALLAGPFKQMALGLDPLDLISVRQKLIDDQVYFERMGSAICAASAIEMACVDISGKYHNRPAYEVLGGKRQDKLEIYASDVYWEENPAEMVKRGENILSRGIRTIKAHIGYASPREDELRVKALRESLGSDFNLMIDLNCGYDFDQALEAADRWGTYNLFWLEEPLHPNDYRQMRELRSRVQVPIAAGENEFLTHGFRELLDGCVDYAMPDIARCGGALETQQICREAAKLGVKASPHNFSSGVLLAATIHTMAATSESQLLEFDASRNAVYDEFFNTPLEMNDGHILVPETPGFGVELTREILENYAIQSA